MKALLDVVIFTKHQWQRGFVGVGPWRKVWGDFIRLETEVDFKSTGSKKMLKEAEGNFWKNKEMNREPLRAQDWIIFSSPKLMHLKKTANQQVWTKMRIRNNSPPPSIGVTRCAGVSTLCFLGSTSTPCKSSAVTVSWRVNSEKMTKIKKDTKQQSQNTRFTTIFPPFLLTSQFLDSFLLRWSAFKIDFSPLVCKQLCFFS